jgi:hypothetical protein
MPKFSLIKPLDQPPGTRRFLEILKAGLAEARFCEFRMIVAYAKSGPIHRLRSLFEGTHPAKAAFRKCPISANLILSLMS